VACNSSGNIHSYTKDTQGNWIQSQRVNDVDSVDREAFVALAADGLHAVAVWLDLRGNRRNKIFGAVSNDGGKTWSANRMLYASPDSSVCECCKPSAIMRGNDVYVMFRNWLHGNRDLYFIHSVDGGHSFGEAQKLGNESWQLDGCPMDGGGIAISRDGILQTVWNRKGKIYGCEPGKDETQLGIGRNCTMESANGKNIYSWVQNDTIIVMKAGGAGINVGEGQLPLLKELNDDHVICIWQNNKQIHRAVLKL